MITPDVGKTGKARVTRSHYFRGNAKTKSNSDSAKDSNVTGKTKNSSLTNKNSRNVSSAANKNSGNTNSENISSNSNSDSQNQSGDESGESISWSSPEDIVEMDGSGGGDGGRRRRNNRGNWSQPGSTQRTRAAANMCGRDRK